MKQGSQLKQPMTMALRLSVIFTAFLASVGQCASNVAPVAQVISAAMRPGTTLMDVTYQITDPDDATVKVRALAFKDGTRSFANVIRPVMWMEGSQTNIGDTITTGVNHTLTWDVRADWNIDLANVKFEVLCRDNRGLLPLNWITIPATTNTPAVTISMNVPTDAQVLDSLFWLFADGDPELVLTNGSLQWAAASGLSNSVLLVQTSTLQPQSPKIFLYKRMNVSRATFMEKDLVIIARTGISDRYALYAANRPWNESGLGKDPAAVVTEVINPQWVKNTYADGTITMSDRFTGLMWFFDAGEHGYGKMSWDVAMTHCADLVYAGHDDWVLPNLDLLWSMFSQRDFFVGLDRSVEVGYYWSSTVYSSDATKAWFVFMGDKNVGGNPGATQKWNACRVWPVRYGE